MFKNSEDWSKDLDITVIDPDGWDRKNFDISWSEEISEEEFLIRVSKSTCAFRIRNGN
ncbi:hypothetical protein [Vibrio phage vB_VpaP_SJSY21]|nr:hypothetical protein [Vibrio phage vB_VpaP_SJSY21]